MKTVVTFVLGLGILCASAQDWQPLFNGKDLAGWHTLPGGKWEVVEGAIVGTAEKAEKRHGLLLSESEYGDFIAKVQFKVLKGDSGFYFRAAKVTGNVGVHGFQAEVDRSPEVGGLYETGGRAWVVKPDPGLIKKLVTPGEWTQLTVTAIGDDVTVSLNGVPVSRLLDDAKGRKKGHFALQLHGGQDMHVEFRNLYLLPLDEGH